ncbi:sulfate ABC transporter substrate-binding protein [Vibrio ouci]|uniref:Sulfate ABC transporter substrate-binding protein n=1 Tax=Vibrio ouci TaxID=2499078 RepID=A0A4Y8WBI8_9VIBR|nr:sulfate ABC transporter substrate-binding protein [Vibrio ouci]TFH90282.1 sulfate ABC transporter substrate-binding protein [Vibrio ouci]
MNKKVSHFYFNLGGLLCVLLTLSLPVHAEKTLLNVSYDPTREFYAEFNRAFVKHYLETTGELVTIRQSHGGSGSQARAVIAGLQADVLTLALAYDIDAVQKRTQLFDDDWQQDLAEDSAPYTSTIIFLVRKGNPKNIQDWDDLIKDGVEVITPNPKTSGGARWNYLAAWAYANQAFEGNEQKIKAFVGQLYRNVPVLDSGARGSTNTFVQNGVGDVLLAWENEALLATNRLNLGDQFDIVVPSMSILAQPSVAVMTKRAKKNGVLDEAKAYLNYLYSPEGQRLAARHYFRPVYPHLTSPLDLARFAPIPARHLVKVDDPLFGGWAQVQKTHFADGGVFDEIYAPRRPE